MSHPPETADREAQIEALIKRAGDRLQQQLNDLHRGHAAECRQDEASQRPPSDPASGNIRDTESTLSLNHDATTVAPNTTPPGRSRRTRSATRLAARQMLERCLRWIGAKPRLTPRCQLSSAEQPARMRQEGAANALLERTEAAQVKNIRNRAAWREGARSDEQEIVGHLRALVDALGVRMSAPLSAMTVSAPTSTDERIKGGEARQSDPTSLPLKPVIESCPEPGRKM